jgi:aspartyl protease family protein
MAKPPDLSYCSCSASLCMAVLTIILFKKNRVNKKTLRASFIALTLTFGAAASVAWAQSVTLVGTFPNKALMVINGGSPRSVAVGDKTAEGVKVISATTDSATVEIAGKRQVLNIGVTALPQVDSNNGTAIIAKGSNGHHFTSAEINGTAMQFMVDTGASTIAIPGADAYRLNINYRAGTRMRISTANGMAEAWRVRLDSVKVGEITLYGVEAMVVEQGLSIGLLGNSFLSRTNMSTEGGTLMLKKRF